MIAEQMSYSCKCVLQCNPVAVGGWRTVSRLAPQHLTHRPYSSSFWRLPYRILNMNPKKELHGANG